MCYRGLDPALGPPGLGSTSLKFWLDPISQALWAPWMEFIYRSRYGASWRWYYLNWEQEQEFLF